MAQWIRNAYVALFLRGFVGVVLCEVGEELVHKELEYVDAFVVASAVERDDAGFPELVCSVAWKFHGLWVAYALVCIVGFFQLCVDVCGLGELAGWCFYFRFGGEDVYLGWVVLVIFVHR
jgi:hypothetical protein